MTETPLSLSLSIYLSIYLSLSHSLFLPPPLPSSSTQLFLYFTLSLFYLSLPHTLTQPDQKSNQLIINNDPSHYLPLIKPIYSIQLFHGAKKGPTTIEKVKYRSKTIKLK